MAAMAEDGSDKAKQKGMLGELLNGIARTLGPALGSAISAAVAAKAARPILTGGTTTPILRRIFPNRPHERNIPRAPNWADRRGVAAHFSLAAHQRGVLSRAEKTHARGTKVVPPTPRGPYAILAGKRCVT